MSNKFKDKWSRFRIKLSGWAYRTFYGMYGFDNLYFVLFGVAMLLIIVNVFVRQWWLTIPELAVFGYMMFRVFSHKRDARKRENDAFFGFFKRIGKFFVLQKNKFRDRKTHVYRKCPNCKTVLRLPKKKGTHSVSCPKCRNMFNVRIK